MEVIFAEVIHQVARQYTTRLTTNRHPHNTGSSVLDVPDRLELWLAAGQDLPFCNSRCSSDRMHQPPLPRPKHRVKSVADVQACGEGQRVPPKRKRGREDGEGKVSDHKGRARTCAVDDALGTVF
jgi:hypothetical protein